MMVLPPSTPSVMVPKQHASLEGSLDTTWPLLLCTRAYHTQGLPPRVLLEGWDRSQHPWLLTHQSNLACLAVPLPCTPLTNVPTCQTQVEICLEAELPQRTQCQLVVYAKSCSGGHYNIVKTKAPPEPLFGDRRACPCPRRVCPPPESTCHMRPLRSSPSALGALR